jgi:hypothetical protein
MVVHGVLLVDRVAFVLKTVLCRKPVSLSCGSRVSFVLSQNNPRIVKAFCKPHEIRVLKLRHWCSTMMMQYHDDGGVCTVTSVLNSHGPVIIMRHPKERACQTVLIKGVPHGDVTDTQDES